MKTLLPGYLLSSQGDRSLMAHSVEGRFPFFDHRVAEEMLSRNCILRKGYFDPALTEGQVKKCRRNPAIGFKDNMAFIGILSTQLLDQLFVQDFDASGEIPADRVRVTGLQKPV